MELLYVLLVILIVTRLFGELAFRFKLPVLAGELIAGVILGVLVHAFQDSFPVLYGLHEDRVFHALTELGIFFLMLLAGVEMRPKDLTRATGASASVALGGMVLPLALGIGLGWVALPDSDWKLPQMLFLGVALSITAVPITIATLMELKQLKTKIGSVIVSAAVIDDVLSLFLLAALTSLLESGGAVEFSMLGMLTLKVAAFFIVTVSVGHFLFPVVGRLTSRLKIRHIEFSTLLLWGLAFGLLAEALDMHFILGAYAAGLFFTKRAIDEEVHRDVHEQIEAVTLGFFAPIFFASIGMSIDLAAVTAIPLFLVALTAAAFAGKLLGAGIGASLSGMGGRESLAVGVAMNARGAVELIIAAVALRAGLFDHPQPAPPIIANLYSAVVLMGLVATIFSPIALRKILSKGRKSD